ncbi:MAG: hypothetical protein ACK4TA_11215 [Saprospiraceae bacterium]
MPTKIKAIDNRTPYILFFRNTEHPEDSRVIFPHSVGKTGGKDNDFCYIPNIQDRNPKEVFLAHHMRITDISGENHINFAFWKNDDQDNQLFYCENDEYASTRVPANKKINKSTKDYETGEVLRIDGKEKYSIY